MLHVFCWRLRAEQRHFGPSKLFRWRKLKKKNDRHRDRVLPALLAQFTLIRKLPVIPQRSSAMRPYPFLTRDLTHDKKVNFCLFNPRLIWVELRRIWLGRWLWCVAFNRVVITIRFRQHVSALIRQCQWRNNANRAGKKNAITWQSDKGGKLGTRKGSKS
jgi:hypothetical protein